MTADRSWTVEDLLQGRSGLRRCFDRLAAEIEALGEIAVTVTKTQVAFGAKRKFAWLWFAPATKKCPEGILMLTLDLTHQLQDDAIRHVQQTYPGKWTHQIAVLDESVVELVRDRGWLDEALTFGLAKPAR